MLLQLFEVLAELFLFFHQLLHGPLILPIDLRVFCQLPAELLHFLAQFCGAFARLPHLFFDIGVGLVALFADVQLRRWGKGAGGRSRHLRSVDAVVVPHLKPVFEHISLYNAQLREGPFKEKPVGPPTGCIHWNSGDGAEVGGFSDKQILGTLTDFQPLVSKSEPAESVVIRHLTIEVPDGLNGGIDAF